jgi:hypothetical protein
MTSEDLNTWIACDQCNIAQAMYLIKLVDGELYFCSHHYNKNKEALDKVAFEMIELNKIEEVPQLTEMAE